MQLLKEEFQHQLDVGKTGESLYKKYLELKGYTVNFAKTETDKNNGIDLWIVHPIYRSVQVKYEYSYARYKNHNGLKYTGNVALEIFGDHNKYILGGHILTKADDIIHIMGDGIAVVMVGVKLRKFLIDLISKQNIKYKISTNKSFNKITQKQWTTQTVAVPFEDLKILGIIGKEEKIFNCQ